MRARRLSSADARALFALDQRCFVLGIAYPPTEIQPALDRPGGFRCVVEQAGAIATYVLTRRPRKQSVPGRYLDPLADKSLLSELFVALSVFGALPWPVTILAFTRDGCILSTGAALYLITDFRDFRPTWWSEASATA